MTRVAVVGLGNILVGDDAFGPYVVRQFDALYDTDEEVQVLDLGTPGLDLAPHLDGLDALVVVDTVRADGPPGTLRTYTKEELLARPTPSRTNPHQPGVKETLLMLDLEGEGPTEVLLVGVVPERVETGVGMTRALHEAVPATLARVAEELDRLGHPARRRAVPRDPDIWWERPRRVPA
ncbi:MAG: hydrogenase maturation protease [Longimicrobiales bacterium]|nr:hydrogenase maturation protease [Longimicrobiales bacterium]